MRAFSHFAAIDWSGAAGERHKGIAVALADAAGGPPAPRAQAARLVAARRARLAARRECPADTLVGLDLGIALPFADCGAFFPGWADSPADAQALWAAVDALCRGAIRTSPRAASSITREAARYFRRHGGREGARFHAPDAADRRGRFRVTEQAQAAMGCKPYSNFNLVGAAQVGKSSLTGMRVLHRLGGRLPVWPVDPLLEDRLGRGRDLHHDRGLHGRRARGRAQQDEVLCRTQRGAAPRSARPRSRARARSTTTAPTRCSPPPGCADTRTGPSLWAPAGLTARSPARKAGPSAPLDAKACATAIGPD